MLLLNSYVELTFFLKDNKNLLTFWLNGPKVTAYQRALVKADALSLFERGELNGVGVGITKKQYGHLHNVIFQIEC